MAEANVLRVERAPALIRSQVTDNLRQAILERQLDQHRVARQLRDVAVNRRQRRYR